MISLLYPKKWDDYQLIDCGGCERLERFGRYVFRRPDPQAIWKKTKDKDWSEYDGIYIKKNDESGSWKINQNIPERWTISYKDVTIWVEPTPFKHMGVFPEQEAHWEIMREKILGAGKEVKVLNLFGYTGVASVICAKAGASVTHVDASRPAISWARENMMLSGLSEKSIRWILEDVPAFVAREARRGNKYDAIIMDPPAFGHGARGEVWKFNKDFPGLLSDCAKILSDNPKFVIVNAYALSSSALMLKNLMQDHFILFGGKIDCGELVLRTTNNERELSTGIFGRLLI